MSGKSEPPPASPVAPRLLLYVAEHNDAHLPPFGHLQALAPVADVDKLDKADADQQNFETLQCPPPHAMRNSIYKDSSAAGCYASAPFAYNKCDMATDNTNGYDAMPAPSATTVQMRVGSFPIEEARQKTDNLNCKDDDKFPEEKSLQMLTSVSRETYNILSVDSTQSNNMINRSLPAQLDPSDCSLNPTDGRNDSSGAMVVPGHLPLPAHQMVSQNRVIINQSQLTINQNQNTTELSITRPQEMAPVDHADDSMQNIRNNINYQLLEHNISHQSILNQSISILNQQVIANRMPTQVPVAHTVTEYNGSLSMEPPEVQLEGLETVGVGTRAAEGEIVVVNNVPHQFMRTPDGLVLAMLPQAPVGPLQSDGSNGSELFSVNVQNAGDGVQKVVSGQCTDSNIEMSVPRMVQLQTSSSQTITVPYGWRRIVNGSSVLYISPSGAALSALQHLREYLQTPGTCKCGLTCPLRAEHAFSFDPKVSSKAYEWEPDASRADLTKLCNHKRKMLALLQQPESARKGEHAMPDTAAMKRKKKKRPPVQNISVSQLMARRDNRTQDARGWQNTPPNQCMQETMDSNGLGSPNVQPVRPNNQLCLPPTNNVALLQSQQMNQQQTCQLMNKLETHELTNQILTQNTDIQLNRNMPTRNHYLTVNGGCINPSAVLQPVDNSYKMPFQQMVHKTDIPCTVESQGAPIPVGNMQMNTINHILGPNGQIIGVHTGLPRSDATMMNTPMPAVKSQPMSNQTSENGTKFQNALTSNKLEDKTYNYTESQNPNPCSMNVNSVNATQNQDSTSGPMNMFCGSNPPALTPEVMQKINQQQQLFIQQNQKQIEMAMKGIRSQIIAGSTQLKPTMPNQTHHVNNIQQSPGQLIIQNGTVMLGNQAKPIPWTAKRNKNQNVQNSFSQNISNSPTRMGLKSVEFNDNHSHHNNTSIPQGQIQSNQDNGGPQSQNTNIVNTNVYSRVPPLHQHCPQTPQQPWPIVESHKKKGKSGKYNKKNRPNHDNQNMHGVDGSNFDNRHNQDNYRLNSMSCQNDFSINTNPSPSFMEDPSGYLAQQTALLNSTISRQVGNNGNLMMYNNSHPQNMSGNQHINSNERNIQTVKANQIDYCLSRNNGCESSSSGQMNRSNGNNSIHNSPSQSNIPDSSIVIEKRLEGTKNNAMTNHCKGCMATKQSPTPSLEQCMSDTIVRLPNGGFFMKAHQYQDSLCKSETDSQSESPSPNQSIDDNPVTSSTFLDRSGSQTNHLLQDSRGPIQGGTVSTSNVSPMETMQLPEPSPTPSNSSRNTDTPQSNNSGSIHISSSCPFAVPSPAYSNPGSCRESTNSNPATPTPSNVQNIPQYNSPGSTFPQNAQVSQSQGISNQMINFISNHNVNRNIMDSETVNTLQAGNSIMKNFQNISNSNYPTNNSFVQLDQKRQVPNNNMLMPGYCPPPHLGGGLSNSCLMMPSNQTHKVVTTMASGHTMIRDTITSVLAGKALTATTSMNSSSNTSYNRSQVLPSMLNSYAIPPNHPDPFINSVNLTSSYPMHIAGTIAQSMISKSPLEMVQSVVSSIPISRQENIISPCTSASSQHGQVKSTPASQNMQQGQILISSNGQFMVAENNHGTVMPPPAPKNHIVTPLPPMSASPLVTNVTASVTQVIPAVGGIQQVLNQPTVLVNTLPTPFVIQPQMMTVDGQVMQQNTVLPQIVSGNVISHGQQSANDGGANDISKAGIMPRTLLSPETSKKKGKKRKSQNMAGMLHIAAQQSSGSVLVHHTSPQQSPQFSPRSFQVSPNQGISTAPMLQALTIVPGKSGTPAHIVMNSQTAAGNFGSQQIITNSPPTQQINLLQPVNLINNTAGVVPNFPAFQQFIVPGLGGMVMTADGTLLQDTGGMSMQLQLQNVNGQNVLTPVQNQGVLTTGGNTGVVIRTQNPHGKIMQSQQSPGAQFLSPNSQIMMNSPGFNGQLSPLIANVSPSSVAFNTSPQQVRSANIQPQEFIQCSNQMGQTLMVPMSPNQIAMSSASTNQANATFVQQNTTIVQQQTTMVANNQPNGVTASNNGNIVLPGNGTRLSIDPNIIFNQTNKQHGAQMKGKTMMHFQNVPTQQQSNNQSQPMPTSEMTNTKKLAVHHIPSQINQEQTTKIEMQHKKESLSANHMTAHMNMNQQSITSQQIVQTMQQNTPVFNPNVRHSVSTQTLVNQQQQAGMKSPPVSHYGQQISGSSPPDTTTHSPLGPLENISSSPTIHNARSMSNQGNYADTTTKSPEPNDQSSLAMVQCVSSSEPDMTDLKEQGSWASSHNEFNGDINIQNPMMMQHVQQLPSQAPIYNVESNGMQFNAQTITVTSVNNQHSITITPANYYDRFNSNKRKNEFGDVPQNNFRNEKMMRTTATNAGQCVPMTEIINYNEPNAINRVSFDKGQETIQRQYASQEPHNHRIMNKSDHGANILIQKVYERHMNSGNETVLEQDNAVTKKEPGKTCVAQFQVGDLVWGPAKGFPAWPGKLMSVCDQDGNSVLVRWFGGDKSLSLVNTAQLQTLSEGLEAHHAARTKCRKSRKLNAQLEKAIQEAMSELDKMTENPAKSGNDSNSIDPVTSNVDIGDTNKKLLQQSGNSTGRKEKRTNSGGNKKSHNYAASNKGMSTKFSPVKIAPHPTQGSMMEVPGRLRSSQTR